MLNFIDINRDENVLSTILDLYAPTMEEKAKFLRELNFTDNMYISPNGVLSFSIVDNYVFFVNDNHIDDKFFKEIITKTNGNVSLELRKVKQEETLDEKFLEKPFYVLNNQYYVDYEI